MLNVLKTRNSYKVRTILNLSTSKELKNLPCQKEEFWTTETFSVVGSTYCLQNERMNGIGITSICYAIA